MTTRSLPVLALSLCYLWTSPARSQSNTTLSPDQAPPRLVVGIMVDQMRYEYLERFWEALSEGGFKRLVRQGFYFRNTHYNYTPTYTGPGHASVYTGTTPEIHGIVGNDWWDRDLQLNVYCAEDKTVNTVGSTSAAGLMSPRRMLSTTIGDELRLAYNFRSKVVGIALKDRGAILPAGHTPSGAYWFDGATGNFVTSTHYTRQLPTWVQAFNTRRLADTYTDTPWTTLLPIEQYQTWCTPDDNAFEKPFEPHTRPVFPHDTPRLRQKARLDILRAIPAGNTLTTDFAIAAIEGEQLGTDTIPDLLAVSYSSTDYIGHQFGPRSIEVADCYLRLDRDIARLLNYLDEHIGTDRVLVFVTADHGGAENSHFLNSRQLPGKYFKSSIADSLLRAHARTLTPDGSDPIEAFVNLQIYLRSSYLQLAQPLADFALTLPGVAHTYTHTQLRQQPYTYGQAALIQRGYYPRRSGHVVLVLDPAWLEYDLGTTHGAGYNYDTHVPLLLYGYGLQSGSTVQRTHITDVAPTLAYWLHTALPSGAVGQPLQPFLRQNRP